MEEINIGKKVIVRGDRSGIFFGTLAGRDGREVKLTKCRRLWFWDGAASNFQLAAEGVSAPRNCKFTVTIIGASFPSNRRMMPSWSMQATGLTTTTQTLIL